MSEALPVPISVQILEAVRLSGFSRSRLHELVKSGTSLSPRSAARRSSWSKASDRSFLAEQRARRPSARHQSVTALLLFERS